MISGIYIKKINKDNILSFILGALIFGTTGVLAATFLANNISYDNSSSGINSSNIQGAIDELYTKANTSYDEYSGTTTYTPSTSTQTISTNNKLVKSDITINPIPSSYKSLTTTTTATANDLLSGKTAYNSNGQIIEGTHVEECVRGVYNKPVNTLIDINLGFNPNYLYLDYIISSDNHQKLFYNTLIDSNIYIYIIGTKDTDNSYNGTTMTNGNSIYSINNGHIIDASGITTSPRYKQGFNIYYMACR